jgi:hypothetical protein
VPCAKAADGSRKATVRIKTAFDAQRMVISFSQYGVRSTTTTTAQPAWGRYPPGIQCLLYEFVNAE